MKNTILVIIILVAIGIGAFYITKNNTKVPETYTPPAITNTTTNTPQPATTTPSSTPPAVPTATTVTVSIKNFSFNPSSLTIKTGTKVTWINNDSAPHTVTSDSGIALNSATLSPGQSYSHTFTNIGTENYHCTIHPMMKGKITVTK